MSAARAAALSFRAWASLGITVSYHRAGRRSCPQSERGFSRKPRGTSVKFAPAQPPNRGIEDVSIPRFILCFDSGVSSARGRLTVTRVMSSKYPITEVLLSVGRGFVIKVTKHVVITLFVRLSIAERRLAARVANG